MEQATPASSDFSPSSDGFAIQPVESDEADLDLDSDVGLEIVALDAGASPMKLVVDPDMRSRLRDGLLALIECHDEEIARFVGQGQLSLDSYKEYVELFARSLRECMESKEGVGYLLRCCGFEVPEKDVNLAPEWRWRKS